MKFPDRLRTNFELMKQVPSNKPFDVFLVKDRTKDLRLCVLRLLPASLSKDKSFVDAFMAYFSQFSEIINRAYIPTVYSVSGQVGGNVYVLEEQVSGIDLTTFIKSKRNTPDFNKEIISVVGKVCEALHHAHQKDLFHLGITPEDILIDETTGRVKLVGFGVQLFAQVNKIGLLSAQARKTIAPEVLTGAPLRPRADVYSLAQAINEVCPDIFFKNSILARAMANNPMSRHLSARDLQSALNKLLQGIQKIPVGKPKETPLESKGGLKPVWSNRSEASGTGTAGPSRNKTYTRQTKARIGSDTAPQTPTNKVPGSILSKVFAGIAAILFVALVGTGLYVFHGEETKSARLKDDQNVHNVKLGDNNSEAESKVSSVDNQATRLPKKPENEAVSLPGPLKLRWSIKEEYPESLTTWRGLLMYFAHDCHLRAVDIANGKEKWQITDSWRKELVVHEDLFYFAGGEHNRLRCYDPSNERFKWISNTDGFDWIAVSHGVVICATSDGGIYGSDAKTGHKIWEFHNGDYNQNFLIVDDLVYFRGIHKGIIGALDLFSGSLKWSSYQSEVGLFNVQDGVLYVCVYNRLTAVWFLKAIEIKTDQVKWATQLSAGDRGGDLRDYCHPPIFDNMIFVAGLDRLLALDTRTGKALWHTQAGTQGGCNCCPMLAQGTLFVRHWNNRLCGYNYKTGIKKFDIPQTIRSSWQRHFTVDDKALYFHNEADQTLSAVTLNEFDRK